MGKTVVEDRACRRSPASLANTGRARVRWWPLPPMLLLTTAVPLAIHAHMIDTGVPYPTPSPGTSPIAWADDVCTAVGVLLLLGLLGPGLQRRPAIIRALAVFLLVAGMAGRLFRDPFMDVINTAAPVLSTSTGGYLLHDAMKFLPLALIACLSTVSGTVAHRSASGIGAILLQGLVIGSAVWLIVGDVIDPSLAPTIAWFDARGGDVIEQPPYDARILIPAYATFLEDALSTIITIALVWDRLPGAAAARIGTAAGLTLLLLGPMVRPFVDGVADRDHWIAFLTTGQFTIETLALGTSAGLTCLFVLRPPSPLHRRSGADRQQRVVDLRRGLARGSNRASRSGRHQDERQSP